jgi:hypothetical protein
MKAEDHNSDGFWQRRYESGTTGWDAGAVTEPLRVFFEGLTNKNASILIPGAGNSYEAEWLHDHGFKNVFVLDIAPAPLQNLSERVPDFPSEHLIEGDFFAHTGRYDLIIEQTFFCAIDPSLRSRYAAKMHELLNPGGKLAGVMFDCRFEGGPPFGGSREEYQSCFSPYFNFRIFEACRNSIAPRAGKEIFVILEKK